MKLISFSISHYSEKVRWFLDAKALRYDEHVQIPGLHLGPSLWYSGQTMLPLLITDNGRVIAGSTPILQWIEMTYPDPRLFPRDPDRYRNMVRLITWMDEEIGIHVRRLAYFHILQEPEYADQLLKTGLDEHGKKFISALSPLIRSGIRQRYLVSEGKAMASERILKSSLDTIAELLEVNAFLAGKSLSPADISLAALLYPLVFPGAFPWVLPSPPPRLRLFLDIWQEHKTVQYAKALYLQHRPIKNAF